MIKTYILGAGSSVEFGYPLGVEIFAKAEELAYSKQQNEKSEKTRHLLYAFEAVRTGLSKIFTNLPDDYNLWPNFEEIYTFIDRELSIPDGPRVNGITEDLREALIAGDVYFEG